MKQNENIEFSVVENYSGSINRFRNALSNYFVSEGHRLDWRIDKI